MAVALGLWIGAAMPPSGRAGGVPAPTADEHVVQLPPFLVEDTTAALRWRYLAVGNIELLSLCDDAETIRFVERVHRIDELFHTLVPARFCFQSDTPEIYLVVNEDVGRFRSREIIEQLVQKEGATIGSDGTVRLPMIGVPAFGPLARAQERRVTFFPNLHLWDADGSVLLTILHPSSSENFTLSVEGVTYALERRLPALPEWFTVGMAALFGRAKIGENDISVLPAQWISASESAIVRDPNFPRTLLPLQQLFFPDRPTDPAGAREFDEIWRAESALFVRWALLDQNGAHREALWRFVDRLERESISESLFQQEFGCGFADAFDRLSDYLSTAVTERVTVDGPKTIPLPHLKLRDATPLEVARLRGEWERLEIPFVRQRLPSLLAPYVAQARRTLHRAYDRDVRDPRLSALLGLTECDAGNATVGMPFLEDAMRGRVVRPHVYLEIARARYAAAIGNQTTDQKLSAEQIDRIDEPLRIACRQAPPLRDVYLLMAEVWSHAGNPPPADRLATLNAGVRLFPQITPFVGRVIQLNLAAGRVADAIQDADTGARAARSHDVRAGFERLKAGLLRLSKDQQTEAGTDH